MSRSHLLSRVAALNRTCVTVTAVISGYSTGGRKERASEEDEGDERDDLGVHVDDDS